MMRAGRLVGKIGLKYSYIIPWLLLCLLMLGLYARLVHAADETPTHTQTLSDFPVNQATFFRDIQLFLANEDALRYRLMFDDFVSSSWTLPSTIIAPLVHQTDDVEAFVNGFYVFQSTTLISYGPSSRTFIFLDWLDTRTNLTPALPEVAFTGGTGCFTAVRQTRFLKVRCTAGSAAPTPSTNVLPLYYADTGVSSITAVVLLAPTAPIVGGGGGGAISSITGTPNQIQVSTPTGAVVVSIPNNPTLPGTTTGTFSGPLTGNVTGNLTGSVTGNATTATALAADGADCSAGQAPLGVNASGAATGCFDVATETELQAHLTDPTDAHAASAITFAPNGSLSSINTQAAILELRDETPRIGGVSPCSADEIFKTAAGLWACATDASAGGGGTPGGATTQVQINIANAFAGDADLTWDSSLNRLTATGGFVGPLIGNANTSTALAANPADCAANQFGTAIAANGDLTCAQVGYSQLSGTPATLVKTDQGNTYTTGAQNFAASTSLTLPTAAGASPTLAGQLAYDSTSHTLEAGVNGVNKTVAMTDSNITGNAATATALAADGANCSAGQFPLGVSTTGAAQNCTALPSTIAGTANQITASAATGAITLSITTNPTLPGTTTGTFSGNLTGNASSATLAATATALAADGANCAAGQSPLGVDTAGAAQGCFAVTTFTDDRLPAMTTPSPLSNISQIICNKPTIYVEGSTIPVNLSSPAWILPGTFNGQECRICGSHITNTVTAPNSTGVRLEGNTGSVSFGLNTSCVEFVWTGTQWRQANVPSLQQGATKNKLIGGLTAAAPLQLRGGTADAPSTTGFDIFDDGSGNPVFQGVSAGGVADIRLNIPAAKNLISLGNGIEFERTTVAGVHTYSNAGRPRGTMYWDAAAIKPDGTQCVAVSPTVASGPSIDGITCTTNAAAKLSVKVRLPDRYVGGDIYCRLVAHDVDTSGHISAWNARAQCRTPGTDPINATWGTAVAMNVSMTTANIPYSSAEATITPNGACVGGDMLFLELNQNTGSNTDDGDAVIEGLTCEFLQGSRGD